MSLLLGQKVRDKGTFRVSNALILPLLEIILSKVSINVQFVTQNICGEIKICIADINDSFSIYNKTNGISSNVTWRAGTRAP